MKTLASLAVAATVGFAALIGPAEKAEAGDAGAAIAGFAIGAIVGSHLSPYYHRGPSVHFYYGPPPRPRYYHRHYYPQPYYGGYNAHTQWCLSRYRTYNPYTNLYFYRPGLQRHCISPYG